MLTKTQFSTLSSFLKDNSGYVLEDTQSYILESRMPSILAATGLSDPGAVIAAINENPQSSAAVILLQIMTVNETMFFRDQRPFTQFAENILPALAAATAPRTINIWCCACSSGQEPYSLAMLIHEEKSKYPGFTFRILASDLSAPMVKRGEAGIYSTFEIERGLSAERREKYFVPYEGQWRLREEIRALVEFDVINLLKIPTHIGTFDVVFCRNVLIYFDSADKRKVLTALRKVMPQGAYLQVGAAEILTDYNDLFVPIENLRGSYSAV